MSRARVRRRPLRLGASRAPSASRHRALCIDRRRPRDRADDNNQQQHEPEHHNTTNDQRHLSTAGSGQKAVWRSISTGRFRIHARATAVPCYPRKNWCVSRSHSLKELCSDREPSSSRRAGSMAQHPSLDLSRRGRMMSVRRGFPRPLAELEQFDDRVLARSRRCRRLHPLRRCERCTSDSPAKT